VFPKRLPTVGCRSHLLRVSPRAVVRFIKQEAGMSILLFNTGWYLKRAIGSKPIPPSAASCRAAALNCADDRGPNRLSVKRTGVERRAEIASGTPPSESPMLRLGSTPLLRHQQWTWPVHR
jgi:hypothetical protein